MTSLGRMSGVNWMRLNSQPVDFARLRASIVLPTPGTSSISRWPGAEETDQGEANFGFLADDHFLNVLQDPFGDDFRVFHYADLPRS